MIFLILTAADDDGAQLEILADISRAFLDPALRDAAMRAQTYNEFITLLKTREPSHQRRPISAQRAPESETTRI